MRKCFSTFIIILLISVVNAQPPTDKRLAGLDTFAARILKEWHAPGVTIAVVEKGKVIYAGGFGYRDYEKKLPVTENTLFAIGSCTKAFTAAMIGMLAKGGKLDLDKPVRNYLPELKFQNEYTNDHATIRDMLCHRTGLPRHDYSWYGSTASRSELLQRIQYMEPSAELREKYQYNNFMYMALGMVIEKITGKSWEENVKEKILTPLGMSKTILSVTDMAKTDDHSLAYTVKDDNIISPIPYRNIDAIAPAGAINSCAKDMANWLITWINDGKFNGKEIVPSIFRTQAITAQIATGGLPGLENPDLHMSGYGFAWGLSSYRGHYRVEHSGGIDGFITSTSFFPTDSIGVFVVTDQSTPTTSIRNFIVDRLLKLSYRNWSKSALMEKLKADSITKTAPNTDSINRIPNTKPSHALNDYAGVYENKGYGQAKIFMERDTLWIDYNEAGLRTKSYLHHYHYDVFRARSTEETEDSKDAPKIRFNSGTDGKISSFESQMEPAVKDIVFEKLPLSIKIDKNELQKYTGEYELNGVTVKVYVRDETTLMVLVPGQPDYELLPTKKDEFDIKVAKGYSVKFEVNDRNEVLSLSFVQPNGIFKATKKK